MADTMWVNTQQALSALIEVVTCKKCKQKLANPHQFLNCGHFACFTCIGSSTNCVDCKTPGQVSNIHADSVMNDFMQNLNIIIEAVGLGPEKNTPEFDSPIVLDVLPQNMAKPTVKVVKKKLANDTMNTSICESVISRSTTRGKNNETIPKNINKKNKKGETALHTACRTDHIDRVNLLLQAGADPNTKDHAGWTPLQEAVSYGFIEVTEALLKAGAKPNMYGCDNRTALHEAVIADNCDMASLLINSNANRQAFDNVGKKPMDYCKSKKMANLFKSLQETAENQAETTVEQHTTMDLDKTQNYTLTESKIILYGSALSLKSRKQLLKLSSEKKLKVSSSLGPSVSHVIVDTDGTGQITLTYDVLYAILCGKWLLGSDCLLILLDSTEKITVENLSLFEVNPPQLDDGPSRSRENVAKQNPKLFNNCYFYFAVKSHDSIHYDGMSFKKDDLMKLVAAGDGVNLTREPKPEDIQGSLSPFHAVHDSKHSLHKCTHYVIYVPDDAHSASNRMMYNMPFLKTLPLMWFIESILRFKLLDPTDLGL